MQLAYYLLAIIIGLIVPLQSAVNNQLKAVIGGSTILAALMSFTVGTITLAICALLSGQKWAGLSQLNQASWWQLCGGLMGALFVFGTTLLAPRIGVAAMVSLIVAGQITASLLFDRFGILGLPIREIGSLRILGAILIALGVLLVNFGPLLAKR